MDELYKVTDALK